MTKIPTWAYDPSSGAVRPRRAADPDFTQRTGAYQELTCTLCYRHCTLRPGDDGWCRSRGNRRGEMTLLDHGTTIFCGRCIAGYQSHPFRTFKPGLPGLLVGGVRCTAGCTFCIAGTPWSAERTPWLAGVPQRAAPDALEGWMTTRAMLHPSGVIDRAQRCGARHVLFGVNEPTLSFEWTYDVARLAKRAGLTVYLETNGFSGPAVVRKLAPHVDAVDVGIKGSGDPEFYAKWMRSPGALPTVLATAEAWRDAGVHVTIGDVLAPPHMQSRDAASASQQRLFTWIADRLGPHTPVIQGAMYTPVTSPNQGQFGGVLLASGATMLDLAEVGRRAEAAYRLAREACGLAYFHVPAGIGQPQGDIRCHACGGLLLRFYPLCNTSPETTCDGCLMEPCYCPFPTHEQHVTDGRCDHCGAAVPIVALSRDALAAARARIVDAAAARIPAEALGPQTDLHLSADERIAAYQRAGGE